MSHAAWNAVTPHLCPTRRVIAFDIAGFGLTPPLTKGTVPSIPNLVDGLERSIREIGISTPVDIAGNSLGGCMALEAARRAIARSAVAISPPGLWRKTGPHHVKYVFATLRFMARRFPHLLRRAMCVPVLKEVALAVPISVGSACMPEADAIRAVDDLAKSTAFEDTFDNTRSPFSGVEISVPLTVAFGDCDWILTKGARLRNNLPAHTRWIEMRALGHVPMWVDPIGISRLILEGTG
jgi:pimeloyl-ACP methyl ester carboxylesterase